jgi:L-seryl-tRNA(Ser) seleniumtransferase
MASDYLTRREVLQRGTALALPGVLAGGAASGGVPGEAVQTAAGGLRPGPHIYESIGVRPLINARGTYTILSGSLMLPEVREAMVAAARHYVHLDELAEAVGRRLAELTGAQWGMVTSGCAAALTHASAACVAGGNPDLHVRLPDLRGFPRDEAIIPKSSRNVYDAAVRAVGLRVVEVETAEELDAAFGPRTAMVYVFAGPWADEGPVSTAALAARARKRGVPVLVDAAAEILTVPNVHLQAGADLVGYSGGKCLRGPQTAGILIGREDLVRAAWVQSAPHHGFGRSMKVGKEEAMGMLMAVEMWMKRDHEAEWARWTAWLETIAARVSTVDGVTTSVVEPIGLSNRTPTLAVRWDRERIGLSGREVGERLFAGDPRVALTPSDGEDGETGLTINPYMLSPGEDREVATALHALLSSPPPREDHLPASPAADLTGEWEVDIAYAAGQSTHRLFLRQQGHVLDGVHRGDFVERPLRGRIEGSGVELRSVVTEKEDGNALDYTFVGTVTGETMGGPLDLGEYLKARWTARRES